MFFSGNIRFFVDKYFAKYNLISYDFLFYSQNMKELIKIRANFLTFKLIFYIISCCLLNFEAFMKLNKSLLEEAARNNGIITTENVEKLGFSRALLSEYVKSGTLLRVRQGVYILPDSVHDDMYTLMLRSSKIVFSHGSALFLNGIAERTPFIHHVTIPSDFYLPNSIKNECVCFYVKSDLFALGLTERKTSMGNEVRCYNAERTICDILRSRSRLDEETIAGAMKNYAASEQKDLNLLAEYAQKFKVFSEVKRYLEVLL